MEFKQVVLWPGTIVGKEKVEDFEKFILEELDTHVKYIEEFNTLSDRDDPESGGRNDVLFYVATEDIPKFAVPRLTLGMRWIEDVLDNETYRQDYSIYPESMKALRCW